jgi:tetratricopeptide (TPR) repeat protein/tRNA A-37 threonylcarbamoyl transferase component Bud32
MSVDADRHLLFGLLALQNGLIDQSALVAAFHSWTRDKGRPLADHLVARGDLDPDQRAAVEAMAALHLKKHGDDPERSLAAVPTGRSTRERLVAVGDTELTCVVDRLGSAATEPDGERTATGVVGASTAGGQRFRLLRPHARGGLGAVFVALDTELSREVALKQILDRHADDLPSRRRFLVEAEVTGGLEHPGIVPVYGLGTYPDGRPFYAMRFIKGDSLKAAIERFHADEALRRDPGARALALQKLLRRFLDVCNAIDYAHSRGVLHRDLKPANVMVGPYGETLVVDWGLAKVVGKPLESDEATLRPPSASGSSETLPGAAVGTPAYMSPEQAAGDLDRFGPASDVYSLGATLYCVLTGKAPFAGEAGEVIRRVLAGAFPPPRQLDPSIDPALEAVCLKAMATDPDGRYPSCRALADDVERWLADEPVSAWREPLARRARRWARRNRTAMAVATAVVLAGLVGLAAATAVQTRANRALRRANAAKERALAETRQAKQATDRALAETKQARDQAEAVSNFLVEALRSPDPAESGRDVRVADVLDRAVKGLDAKFAGSEATKGALLNALAETYRGLGFYDKAIQLHERAVAARESALGPDHADTLVSRSELATDYRLAGRPAVAIPLLEATIKSMERTLGPRHAYTLQSRCELADAYWHAGRRADTIRTLEATLPLAEQVLGPEQGVTVYARESLAHAYWSVGRAAEAIPIFEATLPLMERTQGPDNPNTLISRGNLANAYQDVGRTAEAVATYEATIRLMERKLGPDHPETLGVRSNLAVAHREAGRPAEAIRLDEATLALMERKPGPDHPTTLICRIHLAHDYRDVGRMAEAVAMYEATLPLFERKFGPDHPFTLASRGYLANAYELLGRRAEAEPLRRDVLERRRKTPSSDDLDLAGDLAGLGRNLVKQQKWSEAEPILRECLAIRERAVPGEWPRFDAMSLLGGALLGRGRHAEAGPLLLRGYEGMRDRRAQIPAQGRVFLTEAGERVVRLYESWGKSETAAAWRAKLVPPDWPEDVFARP